MGLIIKDKIQALLKGYPTVSDKYNVQGGVLGGATKAKFGDVLKFTGTDGSYAVAAGATKVEEIAGILLATNAKTPHEYPAENPISVMPGEAVNLMLCGFVAVPVAADATPAEIAPGKGVAIVLASGALTTADKVSASTIVALPGWEFTGVLENKGTEEAKDLVAEIVIK